MKNHSKLMTERIFTVLKYAYYKFTPIAFQMKQVIHTSKNFSSLSSFINKKKLIQKHGCIEIWNDLQRKLTNEQNTARYDKLIRICIVRPQSKTEIRCLMKSNQSFVYKYSMNFHLVKFYFEIRQYKVILVILCIVNANLCCARKRLQ